MNISCKIDYTAQCFVCGNYLLNPSKMTFQKSIALYSGVQVRRLSVGFWCIYPKQALKLRNYTR